MVMTQRIKLILEAAKWYPSFAFLPHICFASEKIIWLKKCYVGDYSISLHLHRPLRNRWWADSKELMMLILRDKQ